MLIVRPIKESDWQGFFALSKQAGAGFTSLAMSEPDLKSMFLEGCASFAPGRKYEDGGIYLLVLQDMQTGVIAGISAIKSRIGIKKPFFSFKVLDIAQRSSVAHRHFNMEILMLVNEYVGVSEVGSLFVLPEHRKEGAGRLIAGARYLLMANAPERFSDKVISELRGVVNAQGEAPFWEGVGRKFFKMDFVEADSFPTKSDNQFIIDLMPKHPIYKDLLPQSAQDVIAQVHEEGHGAYRLLCSEGFRYEKCIDIFDGGPTVEVRFEDLRSVRLRQCRTVCSESDTRDNQDKESATLGFVCNKEIANFRAIFGEIICTQSAVYLNDLQKIALGVQAGEQVNFLARSLPKGEIKLK